MTVPDQKAEQKKAMNSHASLIDSLISFFAGNKFRERLTLFMSFAASVTGYNTFRMDHQFLDLDTIGKLFGLLGTVLATLTSALLFLKQIMDMRDRIEARAAKKRELANTSVKKQDPADNAPGASADQ